MSIISFNRLLSLILTLTYTPIHRDDGRIHMWAGGRDKPELALLGHQSDVKCVDWHPHRALIASGSRDSAVKLWDPKMGKCIR